MTVIKRTVGKGMAAHTVWGVDIDGEFGAEELSVLEANFDVRRALSDLPMLLAVLERSARKTIADAGERPFEPESQAHDAVQMLAEIDSIRKMRERGLHDLMATFAFRLGSLAAKSKLARDFSEDVYAAQASREGARKGGGQNAQDERNIKAAEAYLRMRADPKNARKSKSFLKETCGLAEGCPKRGSAIAGVNTGLRLLGVDDEGAPLPAEK